MSTEQYFNGPDSFDDIPHALPYGWEVQGFEDDARLRFSFRMPEDTPDDLLFRTRLYVYEHGQPHDTEYRTNTVESEDEKGDIQEHLIVETVYPLNNEVFKMLRNTQHLLALGAWAVMKPEDKAFAAEAKQLLAPSTSPVDGMDTVFEKPYFEDPDTFPDLDKALPEGWTAKRRDDRTVRFDWPMPSGVTPDHLDAAEKIVQEAEDDQYTQYYYDYWRAADESGDAPQGWHFSFYTTWPLHNNLFPMLEVTKNWFDHITESHRRTDTEE